MKKRLLFCSFAGILTACQRAGDVQPSRTTLASEVVGTYRTNFYLDPSCVAVPSGQLPITELKAESDSSVTLVYTRPGSTRTSQSIEHIRLSRQANGVQLNLANTSIGSLETDRVFTANGLETEGKLLRINVQNDPQTSLYFTGVKQ